MKKHKQKLDAFVNDLTELLIKHNATLDILIDGDTHGVYDEGIGVSFKLPKAPNANFATWSDSIRISRGYGLDVEDLGEI